MEEHVYNYLKQEHPDKLMKKIKKELHSVLPIDHHLLEIEVLKKCTFLKKKLFLSVYQEHIIAFKVILILERNLSLKIKGKKPKITTFNNIL